MTVGRHTTSRDRFHDPTPAGRELVRVEASLLLAVPSSCPSLRTTRQALTSPGSVCGAAIVERLKKIEVVSPEKVGGA